MKTFLVGLSLLISTSSFAATTEALKAVLDNEVVAALSSVEGMAVTATYKCPQCYDVLVTGEQEVAYGLPAVSVELKVRTEMDIDTGKIHTKIIEQTK